MNDMNEINFRRPGVLVTATDGNSAEWIEAPSQSGRLAIFTQYLGIIRRRRWLIAGAIVAALVASLILTLMMTPQYTASSTVEIQRENMNIVRIQGVEPESSAMDMEFYQTQYGLLRSRSLAERVVTDLRLFDDARFFEMYAPDKAAEWFDNGRLRPVSTRPERVQAAARLLLENVAVSPVRLSRLVDVSFTSPDPAFSARIVDAWTRHFIETTLERRYQATSYARRFLEQRLGQLRGRLDESERRLVGYASREGIINIPAAAPRTGEAGGTTERPIIADDLANLNRELTQATADRVQAQSRLQAPGGAVVEALQNDAISGLRQRRAELSAEYSRLMAQFEPNYPPAIAVRDQIQQLDRGIAREEARVRSTLQATYTASASRERDLAARVETLKAGLLDLRRRSIQYNMYQREVDTNRQLYDALLQRYKEIGIAGGVGVNNISVVDSARIPERPSSPRLLVNLLLGLFLGSLAGVGLALALEQIDDAISDPAEFGRTFDLPLLGTIPKSKDEDLLGTLGDRKSELAEAYMAVQTSLSFSTDHGVPRTLTITSTRPGEGKSTTAFAIAQSLARTGRKVLLLDADMRAPSVHHLINADNERGLSNFLTGDDDLERLIRKDAASGVSVMSAGPQPPSAAELLASERLDMLLAQLLNRYENVVMDGPPVMGLADAPLLASKTEGTVFVIESHNTKVGQARLAISRLVAAQAHILGAVLTKFQTSRATYGYGYGYEYGYGYGRGAEART